MSKEMFVVLMFVIVAAHDVCFVFVCVQCTVSCGGGVQMRSVQCLDHGRPSSGCVLQLKPAVSEACNTVFCPQPEKKGLQRVLIH